MHIVHCICTLYAVTECSMPQQNVVLLLNSPPPIKKPLVIQVLRKMKFDHFRLYRSTCALRLCHEDGTKTT